jgi:hypothetical protein
MAIKMSGTITEDDFDRCLSEADVVAGEHIEHLVLDWEYLKGWAPGARSAGTWFGMHYRALVGRVAIIADEKWADEVVRITDIYKGANVRRFALDERPVAFAWVREG